MTDPASYPVHLRRLSPEEGGGWLAEVPDLPGCMSDGETPEEAVTNVQGAILSWIEAADDLRRPIPHPGAERPYTGAHILVPADLRQRLEAQARARGMSVDALAAAIIAEGLRNPAGSQPPRERRRD
jgi:antitoxin HicB